MLGWVRQTLFADPAVDTGRLLESLWTGLAARGVGLSRANVALRTLHPEIVGLGYVWQAGAPIRCNEHAHGEFALPRYLGSPLRVLFEGGGPLRARLEGEGALAWEALAELKARGATDYLGLPLRFTNGHIHALTLVSDRAGGFTGDELALFDELVPMLASAVETRETRRVAQTLLSTYVGERAGRLVLEGRIRRGDIELIDAVVLWSDLRGFTRMSLELEPAEVVEVLNGYFDLVCAPIEAAGGEIVKFLGDGVFATWRVDPVDPGRSCATVLEVARAALRALPGQRFGRQDRELHMGVALHVGRLALGNVGSRQRLDFTVIGQTVNLASRLAGLCRPLARQLVASSDFARAHPTGATSLGHHVIRGLPRPEEIFTYP